jgi:hypothetical protein
VAGPHPPGVRTSPPRQSEAPPELARLSRPERAALRALLIRSVAAAGSAGDKEQLSDLVRTAPIEALPAAAELHRVAGSVLRGLQDVDGVPDEVRARLTAVRQWSSLHHLLLTGALGQIGRAFDDAGLSWVVMKGPAVAALLYPEVTDRSHSDLDLLVHRRDYPKAMRILEDLGYEHDIHNWALAEEVLAGQVGMAQGAVHVDLHWHLHYSRQDRRQYAFDVEAMIDRRRTVFLSGVTAPTFDPVDTLLTLAFHAARSDGHRLLWFKDVERSLAVETPDLRELVHRCRSQRCAAPVGVILDRARSLLDADVPSETVTEMTLRTLRVSSRLLCAVVHPVQFHERPTMTRAFTRSVRSTAAVSVAAVPTRAARQLRRHLNPPPVNETDDAQEKQRYLQAVATTVQP